MFADQGKGEGFVVVCEGNGVAKVGGALGRFVLDDAVAEEVVDAAQLTSDVAELELGVFVGSVFGEVAHLASFLKSDQDFVLFFGEDVQVVFKLVVGVFG